jgi:hypothetical protein
MNDGEIVSKTQKLIQEGKTPLVWSVLSEFPPPCEGQLAPEPGAVKALDARVSMLWDCLPHNAMMLVLTGRSRVGEEINRFCLIFIFEFYFIHSLQKRKSHFVAAQQGSWTADDERLLDKTRVALTRGVSLIGIKSKK